MDNNARAIAMGLLAQGVTKTAIGKAIGYDRTSISRWINEPEYNGAHIEAAVLARYNIFACPYLHADISPADCARHAGRPCPTCNVREVRFWKACQTCPHKPIINSASGEPA